MHDEGAYLTPTSTRNIGKIFTVLNKSKVFFKKKKKAPSPRLEKISGYAPGGFGRLKCKVTPRVFHYSNNMT